MPDDQVTEVYVRPRSFEVTVWPDTDESINAGTWSLTVHYRGRGRWGIYRGVGAGGVCMDTSGVFSAGPRDDENSDKWLDAHRYTLDRALELAREWAPRFRCNGMTATEVLALERHRA